MATETVESVVSQILEALNKTGDPDAAATLEDMVDKSTKTPEPTEATAPKFEPVPERIKRPNGQEYVVRKLMDDLTDVRTLRTAYEQKMPVLLYGPPGTGKTAMLEAAYAGSDLPTRGDDKLFTVQGSGDTEVADFLGSYVQKPGGEFVWVDGPLLRAMEANGGEGCPLFIDEIALIDPKVMAVVYGVMDGRNEIRVTQNPDRGTVKAGDKFYVVGACNPNAPGARMSEALLSRFTVQFEVLSDYKLAKTLGASAKIANAASNLSKKMLEGEISWAPQLRELLAFVMAEKTFGTQFAIGNLLAAAPEMDRPIAADVIKRTYGLPTAVPLRLQ